MGMMISSSFSQVAGRNLKALTISNLSTNPWDSDSGEGMERGVSSNELNHEKGETDCIPSVRRDSIALSVCRERRIAIVGRREVKRNFLQSLLNSIGFN